MTHRAGYVFRRGYVLRRSQRHAPRRLRFEVLGQPLLDSWVIAAFNHGFIVFCGMEPALVPLFFDERSLGGLDSLCAAGWPLPLPPLLRRLARSRRAVCLHQFANWTAETIFHLAKHLLTGRGKLANLKKSFAPAAHCITTPPTIAMQP